jgi:hypothetical protein
MLSKLSIFAAIGSALIALLGAHPSWAQRSTPAETAAYDPVINPADFVDEITNKYFTLKPGKKFTYRNSAGTERIEIVVTRETKKIMGVTATVVRATEWRSGVLKEDTRDWYAQDKEGNVWYFGEAVDNYVNGKLNDHAGSWEAGVDGAKPGIIMLARPKVGETYRQEYYKGQAEDMGTVVALNKKVRTPAGAFDNCLQIRDWSRIETASEYKYYCPAVGFLVLEESTTPGGGKVELVATSTDQ